MLILLTLLLIGLTAICYRLGGMGKEEAKNHYIPLFLAESWIRDWICPITSYLILIIWWHLSWWYLLVYPLTAGALSTYWDKLFGFDNFWFHGFMCGLAAFPLFFAGIHWYSILISSIVNAILMGWLCTRTSNVWKEELGRGSILAITRLLLFI